MSIFARMWRPVKGWLLTGIDRVVEPGVILDRAQQEFRSEREKAKKEAVLGVERRRHLRGALRRLIKQSASLEAKAGIARRGGDITLSGELLAEKQNLDEQIQVLLVELDQVEQIIATLWTSIQGKEYITRQFAAERLALISGWSMQSRDEQLNRTSAGITQQGVHPAQLHAEERGLKRGVL